MINTTFLVLMLMCVAAHASYLNGAFETICIPDRTCYYVSKFKTSWRTAQEMCQERIREHTIVFNETDKILLNRLPDNLLMKRYWVLQPDNLIAEDGNIMSIGHEKDSEIQPKGKYSVYWNTNLRKKRSLFNIFGQGPVRRFGYDVHNPKKIVHVNKLYRKKERPKMIIVKDNKRLIELFKRRIRWLKKYNWRNLMNYIVINRKPEAIARIEYLIQLIDNGNYKYVDKKTLRWLTDIILLLQKVKDDQIANNRDNDLLKVLMKKSHKYVDLLNELKWYELVDKIKGKDKEDIIIKINKFMDLVNKKQYPKIDDIKLKEIKDIIELLKKTKDEAIEPELDKRTEAVKKIKQSIPKNWKELLPKVEGLDVNLWIVRIETFITQVDNDKFKEINFEWIPELQNIINLISEETITKEGEKPKVTEEMIKTAKSNLESLKQWKWDTLLQYIDEKIRPQVEIDVKKMITIMDGNHFEQLDVEFIGWFNQIFEAFSKINFAITNGYIYNPKTSTWEKTDVQVVGKKRYRKKRSLKNTDERSNENLYEQLINQSMTILQQAYLFNMMVQEHRFHAINRESFDDHEEQCPFIMRNDAHLVTKLTNCAIRQRFICKR